MGQVELELEFNGVGCMFKCQPQQAVLITFFDESHYDSRFGIEAAYLAKSTGVPMERLRHRISYWIHKTVIKEVQTGGKVVYWLNQSYSQEEDIDQEYDEYENTVDYQDMNIQGEVLNKLIEKKITFMLERHGAKSLKNILELMDKKVYQVEGYLFGIQE